MSDRIDYILLQVQRERLRQNMIWGEQKHSADRWLTILQEEVGEAAKSILESDDQNYVDELIQIAAVAVAMVESYNKYGVQGERTLIREPKSITT